MSVGAGVSTKYLLSTVTADPSDKGLPSCVISTINADRDHDHVIPEGMDAANFLKAPVLMWSHGGSNRYAALPVGTVTSLDVTPGQGIKATWRWLENDPFADRVRNAWEQGVVRGTSIGFRPTKMEPNDDGGVDHLAWELLELSVCPIPANPEAVRTLKTLGLLSESDKDTDRIPQESDSGREAKLPNTLDPSTESEQAYVAGLSAAQVNSVLKVVCEKNDLGIVQRKLFESLQKRGRVLSAVNESKLRAAMDALAQANGVLTEVLAQLMPMEDEDHPKPEMDATHPDEEMDPKKPHKPMMPMMALDESAAYSLKLAEDEADEDGPVLRLMFADDDASTVTLVDDRGQEPVFAVDPAVMRQMVSDVVKEQLHNSLVAPIGDLIQRALDKARGRVQ